MTDAKHHRAIVDNYVWQVTGMTPQDRALNHFTTIGKRLGNAFQELATAFEKIADAATRTEGEHKNG